MQKTGALNRWFYQQHLPASDLERSKDVVSWMGANKAPLQQLGGYDSRLVQVFKSLNTASFLFGLLYGHPHGAKWAKICACNLPTLSPRLPTKLHLACRGSV